MRSFIVGGKQFQRILAGRWSLLAICISFVLGAASPSFAGKVQAKKRVVKVYEKASKKSAVLKKFKKGATMETVERKGMYWQVKLDGDKLGFVSVMSVKRKTGGQDSDLSSALRSAAQKGRRDGGDSSNMRARSAVMGVRGLDESSETAFAGNVKPNLRMVYNMENIHVNDKQIRALEKMVAREVVKKMKNRAQ